VNPFILMIVQFLVAWLGVTYILRFLLPAALYPVWPYVFAVVVGLVVWLMGCVASQMSKGAVRATVLGLGGAVVAALVVQVLLTILVGRGMGVLPYWAHPVLVAIAAISGYWAAEDKSAVPFDARLPFIAIVALMGAGVGAVVGAVIMHAVLPPGTYPRFIIAIPFLIGGFLGLAAGAGLAHAVLYPFAQRPLAR
jgi:hypothetical protein